MNPSAIYCVFFMLPCMRINVMVDLFNLFDGCFMNIFFHFLLIIFNTH